MCYNSVYHVTSSACWGTNVSKYKTDQRASLQNGAGTSFLWDYSCSRSPSRVGVAASRLTTRTSMSSEFFVCGGMSIWFDRNIDGSGVRFEDWNLVIFQGSPVRSENWLAPANQSHPFATWAVGYICRRQKKEGFVKLVWATFQTKSSEVAGAYLPAMQSKAWCDLPQLSQRKREATMQRARRLASIREWMMHFFSWIGMVCHLCISHTKFSSEMSSTRKAVIFLEYFTYDKAVCFS